MNSFSNNNLGDHNNISLSVNHNTGEATKPSKSGNDDNTERETSPAIRVSLPHRGKEDSFQPNGPSALTPSGKATGEPSSSP